MSYEYQNPLNITSIARGITDFYINASQDSAKVLDNYNLQINGKPKTRPGRVIYDSTHPQLVSANKRVSAILKYILSTSVLEAFLFASGQNIETTSAVVTGPTGNPAFASITEGAAEVATVSYFNWNSHLYATADPTTVPPVKTFFDETDTRRLITAGMPSMDLDGAMFLANDIKAKYNLHRVDLTQHALADTTNQVTANNATTLATLITLIQALQLAYSRHNLDAEQTSAWTYHIGQNDPSHNLLYSGPVVTLADCGVALDDLRLKYNAHDGDISSHTLGSVHTVTVSRLPLVTPTGAAPNSYIYRFLYYYSYYVGDIFFETPGPTSEVVVEGGTEPSGTSTTVITNIPILSNLGTLNYDTTNVKIQIYRTINDGTSFFFVGEVTNGTTTFNDSVTDALLTNASPIYTAGGVLDNDPPPICKYITQVNNIAVYANLTLGTLTKFVPNAYIVSKPNQLDAVPGSFQNEVDLPITGVNSISIYPLIFCRNKIYRVEGVIDEQGRGALVNKEVSQNYGTLSNNSIVKTPNGLFFFGENSFYATDGYQVTQISKHLTERLKDIYPFDVYGDYDPIGNRVTWTTRESASSDAESTLYVLDLNFPISEESTFYTHSGVEDSMRIRSLAFFKSDFPFSPTFEVPQGNMLQGDARGYILSYDANTTTDPKIDTLVAAANWEVYPIIWDYESPAFNFGSNEIIKWVPIVTLEAKGDANTSISIRSNNNDDGNFRELKEITNLENITWGDPLIEWGSTEFDYFWNVSPMIKAKRRFLAGTLRCDLKQIQITNSFTIIYNSDDFGLVNSDVGTKQVTLLGGLGWPLDLVDYFIAFEGDDYVTEFKVTVRNSATVITVEDPLNVLPTELSEKWQISGYRKGDTLDLISYGVKYAYISQTQSTFKSTSNANS